MVRKKLDERIRTLLGRCIRTNQRGLLLLVGDHGKDQVPNLHQILRRTADTSKSERAALVGGSSDSVLWCYKKELGFSTHRKKRMEKLKREKRRGLAKGTAGSAETERMDSFELFLTNTDITWCYYRDSHRVLGTTHSMLVLQDFEALTPNIIARTVETVRGGGLVVFLLRTVKSLRQLYAMTMDVHSRYRTEGSGDVVPRFNERFILSLGECHNCLVCDDELNILPLSRRTLNWLSRTGEASDEEGRGKEEGVLSFRTEDDVQLDELKETLRDTPHVGKLVDLARTLDQARAVLTFLEACTDRDDDGDILGGAGASPLASGRATTVYLTAPRGRGKSAALGLCLAGAISFGFESVAVTAPEPENLVSVFRFLVEGLKALKYQEHYDYVLGYNYGSSSLDGAGDGIARGEKAGRDNTKCIVSVVVHGRGSRRGGGGQRRRRQTVRYLRPRDVAKFAGAEIVAIDEAAAIPLPVVRTLMRLDRGGEGSGLAMERRVTFLSSTVNGYEGTGRALSLKLIKELRGSTWGRRSGIDAAREAAASIAGAAHGGKGEARVHERRWAAEAAAAKAASEKPSAVAVVAGQLRELELSHPIRYAPGDPVEAWLNALLCLDCESFDHDNVLGGRNGKGNDGVSSIELRGGAPAPAECELYAVDRDALFSRHRLSESFLQKLWGLYTSAHYKNTPNDLQMLSDAPAHNIFVLLGPSAESDGAGGADALPDILAVVQTSLEGKLSRKTVQAQLARGHRSAGDLIPWTISQQFGDENFAQLSGARVVRVAVHPAVQGMGYGGRAMELLFSYYNGEMAGSEDGEASEDDEGEDGESEDGETPSESDSDEGAPPDDAPLLRREALKPRKKLPPLLLPLSSVPTPRLDWLGTSFGLTRQLHNFWSMKVGMSLLYLRQTANELTGEHSAIMIRALPRRSGWDDAWLPAFGVDARRRIGRLLGGGFRDMGVALAASLLGDVGGFHSWMKDADKDGDDDGGGREVDKAAVREVKKRSGAGSAGLAPSELHHHLTPHDQLRLERYSRNLCDHHLVADLVPSLAHLYFTGRMDPGFRLSSVQQALLCGVGLQRKGMDELATELALPLNQVLAMFNKAVKKMSTAFRNLLVEEEAMALPGGDADAMRRAEAKARRVRDVVGQTLEEDVAEGAAAAMEVLRREGGGAALGSGMTGTRTTPEINDPEIMRYALKGTDEEWADALRDRGGTPGDGGTVQVKSIRIKKMHKKRKAEDDSGKEKGDHVLNSVMKNENSMKKGKKKSKKKLRKTM